MSSTDLKKELSKKILTRYTPTLNQLNDVLKKQPADDGFFHIPMKILSEGGFSENIPGKNETYKVPETVATMNVKPNIVFGKEINYTIALNWTDLEHTNNNEAYFNEYFDFIFTTAIQKYVKQYGDPRQVTGRVYCKIVIQEPENIFIDDGSGDVLYIVLRGFIASNEVFRN